MKRYQKYIQDLKNLFSNTYESAGGQEFRFFHSLNVANIANSLMEKIDISDYDRDVCIIAAIFHDVAKHTRVQEGGILDASHEYEKDNNLEAHERISADLVKNFLPHNMQKEKIVKIQNTICNHSNPKTLIEKILHDADELSEMGSMNLWKMYTYSAHKKRNILNTIKYWFETDRARHLEKSGNLYLDVSKKEANRRIKIVDEVLNDLQTQLETE